jgi:hypothetical protein
MVQSIDLCRSEQVTSTQVHSAASRGIIDTADSSSIYDRVTRPSSKLETVFLERETLSFEHVMQDWTEANVPYLLMVAYINMFTCCSSHRELQTG